MTKNYYAVTVKFGHVGKNKFVIKTIPVVAENGSEAAETARWFGRVKHHVKDAIVSVTKINEEQFKTLKEEKKNDPYFHCKNIQQQRIECIDLESQIQTMRVDYDDEERRISRKMRVDFQQKKYKSELNEYRYSKRNQYESYAY